MIATIFPARFTDGPFDGSLRQVQGLVGPEGDRIWPEKVMPAEIGPAYPEDVAEFDIPTYGFLHVDDSYVIEGDGDFRSEDIAGMRDMSGIASVGVLDPVTAMALAGMADLNERLAEMEKNGPKLLGLYLLIGLLAGYIIGNR